MSVLAPPRWEVIYAEAHAERFRYLAGCGAEFLRRPGVLAVRTGADSNVDNGIVLERDDADIEGLVEWFDEPASLICSGFEASDELRERLSGLGLREETSGVTTGALLGDLPEPSVPDGVSIREAIGQGDLEDWLDVAAVTGLYEEPDREPLPMRHWVARRGERPVGTGHGVLPSGTVLLEHVAVPRRSAAAGSARHSRSCDSRRLSAWAAGRRFRHNSGKRGLYEQFGFTTQPDEGRRWFYLPPP